MDDHWEKCYKLLDILDSCPKVAIQELSDRPFIVLLNIELSIASLVPYGIFLVYTVVIIIKLLKRLYCQIKSRKPQTVLSTADQNTICKNQTDLQLLVLIILSVSLDCLILFSSAYVISSSKHSFSKLDQNTHVQKVTECLLGTLPFLYASFLGMSFVTSKDIREGGYGWQFFDLYSLSM